MGRATLSTTDRAARHDRGSVNMDMIDGTARTRRARRTRYLVGSDRITRGCIS